MSPPVYTTGQILNASDVNNWFLPLAVVKTADQSVTSSTTFVNDSALFLSVAANCTYEFSAWLYWTAGSVGDIKIQWTIPSGAQLWYGFPSHNDGGGTGYGNSDSLIQYNTVVHMVGSVAGRCGAMFGTMTTGGTAGTLQLQWAQNATDATSTVLHLNSRVVLRRLT